MIIRRFSAAFVRLLKYFSFGISVFLPGVYVALGTFHQELIPTNLLFTIASAEFRTPLSLMNEAIMTLIFYEIMRRRGCGCPRSSATRCLSSAPSSSGEATVSARADRCAYVGDYRHYRHCLLCGISPV